MLVLLDQGTPVPLRTFLKGHTVKTAAEQRWSSLSNGDLLRAAEAAGFHVLLTTDKNLAFQQSLKDRAVSDLTIQSADRSSPYRGRVICDPFQDRLTDDRIARVARQRHDGCLPRFSAVFGVDEAEQGVAET